MGAFHHEALDAYQLALEIMRRAMVLLRYVPRGSRPLADQLERAVTSIVLNAAEGAAEFAPAEKARFYRMARRSAGEASAICDAVTILRPAARADADPLKELLAREGAMLTGLIKSQQTPASRRTRPPDPHP